MGFGDVGISDGYGDDVYRVSLEEKFLDALWEMAREGVDHAGPYFLVFGSDGLVKYTGQDVCNALGLLAWELRGDLENSFYDGNGITRESLAEFRSVREQLGLLYDHYEWLALLGVRLNYLNEECARWARALRGLAPFVSLSDNEGFDDILLALEGWTVRRDAGLVCFSCGRALESDA